MKKLFYLLAITSFFFTSCSDDDKVYIPKDQNVTDPTTPIDMKGFYLLHEGGFNAGNSTLAYYDYETGDYTPNIYVKANPSAELSLGDTGNDLQIYKSRLYIVLNASNMIEVTDAKTTKHIGQIEVTSPRYITFDGDFAYVSSYSTKGEKPKGALVSKVDLNSLTVVATIEVGFEPEQLVVRDGELFVANSGGITMPNGGYERTVSVIDLKTFKLKKDIDIDVNLNFLMKDYNDNIFVTSRGDYGDDNKPNIYVIEKGKYEAKKVVEDLTVTRMALVGDSIYLISAPYGGSLEFQILDTKKQKIVSDQFITADGASKMTAPYGLAVDRTAKKIYITDAIDFTNDGKLFCFDIDGSFLWETQTEGGVAPAHLLLMPTEKESNK